MALIQLGTLITDIRGKVAGSVFSKMAAGNTLRNKTTPPKSGTNKQYRNRAITSFLAGSWLTNSPARRATWNTLALSYTFQNKLGQPVPATGYMVYLIHNRNLIINGGGPIATAPAYELISVPAISNINLDAGAGVLEIDLNTITSGYDVFIYSAKSTNRPGISRQDYNVKFLASFNITSNPQTIDFETDYTKEWNSYYSGQFLRFGAKTINPTTGAQSDTVWLKDEIS